MKKNEFDFSIPSRQSYAAIVLIIYKYYRIVIRQLLPLILIYFIGGSNSNKDWKEYALYGIIAISVLSMLYAILAYFKFYFSINGEELVVEKGVFQKKKTSVPFERIQTINIEQNIFHQLLNVVKLVIDTAGTAKNEFEFDALSKEKAEALKAHILDKKKNIVQSNSGAQIDKVEDFNEYKTILNIDITRLIKIGITENHIKSGGLIFVFLYWIYENLSEAGVDIEKYGGGIDQNPTVIIFMILGIIFFTIAFVVSLIRTVLTYFNLSFKRSENGFSVSSGLLTKRNVSALDHKIQMLVYSDNILQKILGYKDLLFKQASSIEIENKKSIKIPGCNQEHIDLVLDSLYKFENIENLELFPVEKNYLHRFWLYESIPIIGITVLGYILKLNIMMTVGIIGGAFVLLVTYLKYRKTFYGFNHEMIRINGGVFGDKSTLLPIYKIQSTNIVQSPYQRRNELASLNLYTASGGTTIPYIKLDMAQKIVNYLVYKVEKDKRKWM